MTLFYRKLINEKKRREYLLNMSKTYGLETIDLELMSSFRKNINAKLAVNETVRERKEQTAQLHLNAFTRYMLKEFTEESEYSPIYKN